MTTMQESVQEEAIRLYPDLNDLSIASLSTTPKRESIIDSLGYTESRDATNEKDGNDRQQQYPDSVVYSKLKPTVTRPGERTASTAIRLRRQGFTMSKSGSLDFAVKSIRRGSNEWNGMLRPFVSDLVFQSLEYRRFQSEVSFRPYTCQAAVLFVDLSHYSKITAAIASRGAHAMSNIVNEYLRRLLIIVRRYGGDVVKFAGDAILVVWEGEEKDLEINLLTAAKCATEMQKNAGSHVIEGTSLCFRIHCGLCFGLLESEIFAAPNHANMQRLYHSVGGDSLAEISELVDIAKAGEICISERCLAYLGDRGAYKDVEGRSTCRLLTKLNLGKATRDAMETHIEQSLSERLIRRNNLIEEEFIHPCVLGLLSHGGLSPTQIAQMRNLCVLFIAMTSNGSSVNWLMEVQSILDRNRCPIVQIIHDDKGVHVVAAINLYESVPETSLIGLEVCYELVGQQVGCAIGMAIGLTFCGVTGCSSVACRWDITGPPAVRAARLMQYALQTEVEVAIDQSVYNDPIAHTRMSLLSANVALKGCKALVAVYTISHAAHATAFRVLETVHGRVHDGLLKQIEAHIRGDDSCRCAVLVTGIPLAGKKTLCQRAAGFADLVPYLHVTDESAGFLQLANTIARWFQYVDVDDIRSRAFSVLEHLEKRRWSRAHDECINLVNLALEVGLRACFIIDRVQFLDDFSVSLVRECLLGRSNFRLSHSGSGISERSDLSNADLGKICFFLVHVALYDSKSASNMVADITRSQKSLDIPIVMVGEARRDELRQLCLDLSDIAADERWIDAFSEASGNCAGYFVERDATIQKLTGKIWSEGQRGYVEITEKLVMSIPPGGVRAAKKLSVREISAEVAMCFSQVFDGLPPLFQTFCKVLTVASRTGFFKLPRAVMWEVLNDLIADGVEAGVFNVVIDEMLDMCLIKIDFEGGAEVLSFQCPALGDIAFDVSTPIQVNSIGNALIERLEPHLLDDFKVPFVVANLHVLVGDGEGLKDELWVQGYRAFMQVSMEMDKADVCKWKESMHDEIQAMGCLHPADILGEEFHIPCSSAKPAISEQFTLIKMYHAPISFSVMGHSLGVICRNVYHEYGAFHGYSKESAFEVRSSMTSACCRYLKEMDVLEEFLSEHGFPEPSPELQKERDMMNAIAAPASSDIDVERKASLLLEEFVPQFVESRLKRLYALVGKLHEGDIPAVVQRSEDAIRLAYEALRSSKCRSDAAQDALMIMATRNWKPKTVPEFLPLLYYQTVARIRNRVLKRLSDPELYIFKHRQTYLDLEAFLIVTPLFYEAQAEGKC